MPTDSIPIAPIERVAFFEEQRRRRRATRRLAAASALSVALMGIPVSVAVTPIVYGVILVIGEVANLIHPLPPGITDLIGSAWLV